MGARGPVPNREDDLARPRSRKGSDQQPVTKGVAYPTTVPDGDEDWHPIAQMLWDGLQTSGQSEYYQDSDWAFAYSICEDLSLYKSGYKRSGQMLQTIYSAMERLLVTEGDRRRVRLELAAPQPEETPATVAVMADYRARLSAVPAPESEES